MATLNIDKDNAIDIVEESIQNGRKIIQEIISSVSDTTINSASQKVKDWKSDTSDNLKQIFNDAEISNRFLSTDDLAQSVDVGIDDQRKILIAELQKAVEVLERIENKVKKGLFDPRASSDEVVARWSMLQAIVVPIIAALVGLLTGFLSANKGGAGDKQGLDSLSFEGKWKYICTSFDGNYQHGGRFIVRKDKDGYLYLSGERMWKDTKDSSRKWVNHVYPESEYLNWKTNWIFVNKNSQMNFEYQIRTETSTTLGYCSGQIAWVDKEEVGLVIGNFYVLDSEKILRGQIRFKKVSDNEYQSTNTLPKNH
jgi:hypothetical protein